MRPKAFLYIWIFAIIFPIPWVIRLFNPAYQTFRFIFEVEWTHILAHTLLFACLAILIGLSFPASSTRKSVLRLAVSVLFVGVVQEGFQHLVNITSSALGPSLYDLVVDLGGAAIGFLFLQLFSRSGWNFLKFTIVKG